MLQSWYLAVDMQLHLLAPLLIYPLWRWAQYASTILALALTAATVVPYIIIFAIKAPAIFMISAS
jgi:peptidoglycan/LPS O-acetylase OafA/YrhL